MNTPSSPTSDKDHSPASAEPTSQLGQWLMTGAGVLAWRGLRRVPASALLLGLVAAGSAYAYRRKIRQQQELARKAAHALSLEETRDATERLASAWGAHLSVAPASSGIGKVRPGGIAAPHLTDIGSNR